MDELLIAGEQQETSKKNILKLITEQVRNIVILAIQEIMA